MRILEAFFVGIGSKSPLSYTDEFHITTIYDNIQYHYIYYKDGSEYILSLISKNTVLEKSGTTIKIDIKDGDVGKFTEKLEKQLSYFSDVYINNTHRNYENEFNIYEGKYFKFKSNSRPYGNLHLLLGQVTYPIDFTLLKIPTIDFPIAIKFDIGEISPTLERENIKYDDRSIELIKERINLAIVEIKDYFKKDTFEIDDLKEYLNVRTKIPYLYFNKQLDHKIKATPTIGLKKDYIWKPLKDVDNLFIPVEDIFFMFDIYEIYSTGRTQKTDEWRFKRTWLERNCKIIFKEDSNFNHVTNAYWQTENSYLFIFVPKNKNYKKALIKLDIGTAIYADATYNRIRRSPDESFYTYQERINRNNTFKLGKHKLIYKYIKAIKEYIVNISSHYNSASEEWIKEYKEKARLVALEQKESLKQRVVYYNGSYRTETSLSKLLEYKYIFYKIKDKYQITSFKQYNDILDKFCNIPISTYNYNALQKTKVVKKQRFRNNFAIFIEVSESQHKRIKKYNRLTHLNEFYKIPELQNILYKGKLSELIRSELTNTECYGSLYYSRLIKELTNFSSNYIMYDIPDNINIKKLNPSCHEIILKLKEYRKIKDKLDIFNFVTYHIPNNHLFTIIRSLKMTKFNSNLYKLNTNKNEHES